MDRDLRRHIDTSIDAHEVRANLSTAYPPTTLDDHVRTDSFDCLVALVRIVFSLKAALDGKESDGNKRDEERNQILAYAWQRFPVERPVGQGLAGHLSVKKQAIEQLTLASNADFGDLFKSNLMDETLWAAPYFRLDRCNLSRADNPAPGQSQWSSTPASTRPAEELFQWDCSQVAPTSAQPLQNFINSRFQEQREDDSTVRWIVPLTPDFIRVSYRPNPSNPLTFNDLRSFHLEEYELARPTDESASSSTKTVYSVIREHRYCIRGIVRSQTGPRGHDFVRLYQPNGRYLIPATKTSIINDDWRVGDESEARDEVSYFLLFSQSTGIALKSQYTELGCMRPINARLDHLMRLAFSGRPDSSDAAPLSEPVPPSTEQEESQGTSQEPAGTTS